MYRYYIFFVLGGAAGVPSCICRGSAYALIAETWSEPRRHPRERAKRFINITGDNVSLPVISNDAGTPVFTVREMTAPGCEGCGTRSQ